MTFRYSLVSDLHVNHPQPKVVGLEENVIVAGDTANGLEGLKMLQKWKRKGYKVFAVDGNHEHYANDAQGRDIVETTKRFYEGLGQLQYVQVADDLWLLGANGWYGVEDERDWLSYMNDGRYAGNAQQVNSQMVHDAHRMHDMLNDLPAGHRAIVVTHTAPSMETLDPRFDGHYSNEWYWSPLMQTVLRLQHDKIAVWHHGHTHAPVDKMLGNVRVVTNPRGYPGENPSWAPITLEI